MRKSLLFLAALAAFTFSAKAQQNVVPTFGKGINVMAADSSFTMKFAARFQGLYETGGIRNEGLKDTYSSFMIRRWRLKFDGYMVNPKIVYKLEVGLSNRDLSDQTAETKNAPNALLDAVMKWNFYKGFTLWAGQTKLPGNRERVISSGNLQFVDRSLVNSLYNIDRDMGVQLHHKHKVGKMVFREAFALSQGEGRGIVITNKGGFEYTGRVEFLPFGDFKSKGDYSSSSLAREEKPKLSICATYDFNDRSSRSRGNTGSFFKNTDGEYVTSNLNTVFVDAMFKMGNWSVLTEYANKKASDITALNIDGTTIGQFTAGTGFTAQAGYLFGTEVNKGTELAARFTNIVPAAELGKGDLQQYTLGLSRYIVGHQLKIQTDVNYTVEENKKDALSWRAMLSMHF